jgi:hypothetical protein
MAGRVGGVFRMQTLIPYEPDIVAQLRFRGVTFFGSSNGQFMDILRSHKEHGTLAPAALNYLPEIPSEYLFVHEHARRHPLGIYNVSLDQLEKAFNRVLSCYLDCVEFLKRNIRLDGELENDNLNEGYNDLLDAQKNLIHSLRSHIDDCYAVLAALVDPASLSNDLSRIRFTDRWLKVAKFGGYDSFSSAISNFKDEYLGPIVNGIKHRQCRLRPLFFYKYSDIRLGYYLEDSDTDGVPGPSPKVHRDRNTAFSFAKHLRLNLFYVYHTSEALSRALKTSLMNMHSFDLKPNHAGSRSEAWESIFRQLSKNPLRVFPDELEENLALVTYSEMKGPHFVELGFPYLIWSPRFPPNMKIKSSFELDGVGKQYKLPYLAPSNYGRVK